MIKPDHNFWNNRYQTGETGWDIGAVSTPLKAYFNQLEDKNLKILIPGAGNAYEAEYLFNSGFKHIFVLDIAEEALANFQKRNPGFPKENLIYQNFFAHKGQYDLIIEQTFFCAIDPALRNRYAEQMHKLLKEKGKLAGLLFDAPLNTDKPPFGGSREEYKHYFAPYFNFNVFETAYNSIEPRAGRELFIILKKK